MFIEDSTENKKLKLAIADGLNSGLCECFDFEEHLKSLKETRKPLSLK